MLIMLLTVVGFVLVLAGASAAEVPGQSMSVDPSSGQSGTSVTAFASGYDECPPGSDDVGNGEVAFFWDGVDQLDVVDVNDGSASTTFKVPESAGVGEHTVTAQCFADNGLTSSTVFTVEPPIEIEVPSVSVDPASGQSGTSVTAFASGYGGCPPSGQDDVGNGEVAFFWDGVDQIDVVEAVAGSASTTFAVPESAAVGDHQVATQCLADDNLTASTLFAVEPPIEARVIVPDVLGMSLDRAASRLGADDLALGEVSGDGDVVEDQDPPPGAEVAAGSTVDVTVVAVEPALVTVPNLVGLNVADVPAALAEQGLELGQQSGDGDVVNSQNPEPGVQVPSGSAVSISVEPTVPPPPLVAVPDVTGMSVDEAGAAVLAAGLVLGNSPDSDGDVQSQQPAAGTLVPPGTAVTLTLAGTGMAWWPIPAVLVLLLGAALAAYQLTRTRRDHRWLRKHVRLVAGAAPARGFDVRESRTEPSPPTLVVRLEPQADSGTQVLEEVPQ